MEWLTNPGERRAAHALKWAAYPEDDLPLWVADLDCKAPPIVAEVLHQAAEHGVHGYGIEPPEFRQAWVDHLASRHAWTIDPDWIVPIAGVVPAMVFGLECFPDRSVTLSPSPAYPYFKSVPERLRKVPITYPVTHQVAGLIPDLDVLEADLIAHAGRSVLLLCNPHNPGGAIYSEALLDQLIEQAITTDTPLISDEIWADLRLDHRPHIALGKKVPETHPSITIMAATKTFNIAGFSAAIAIVPHQPTRQRLIATQIAMPHITPLAYALTAGCLRHGWSWHAELLTALRANREQIRQWADAHPSVRVTAGAATFLAWIESEHDEPTWTKRLAAARLRLSMGTPFGDARAVRLNFGTSPAILTEALRRLSDVLDRP